MKACERGEVGKTWPFYQVLIKPEFKMSLTIMMVLLLQQYIISLLFGAPEYATYRCMCEGVRQHISQEAVRQRRRNDIGD